ncbi:MAG TPA: hypothetical protein PLV13_11725 [Ilumatobacteraceae bacterium]|nr:hypothetical protein [Ilumatobacteraceae bacterium]
MLIVPPRSEDVVVEARESRFSSGMGLGAAVVWWIAAWHWDGGVRWLLLTLWSSLIVYHGWRLSRLRRVVVTQTALQVGDLVWELASVDAVLIRNQSLVNSRSIAVHVNGLAETIVLPDLTEKSTTRVAAALQAAIDSRPAPSALA